MAFMISSALHEAKCISPAFYTLCEAAPCPGLCENPKCISPLFSHRIEHTTWAVRESSVPPLFFVFSLRLNNLCKFSSFMPYFWKKRRHMRSYHFKKLSSTFISKVGAEGLSPIQCPPLEILPPAERRLCMPVFYITWLLTAPAHWTRYIVAQKRAALVRREQSGRGVLMCTHSPVSCRLLTVSGCLQVLGDLPELAVYGMRPRVVLYSL